MHPRSSILNTILAWTNIKKKENMFRLCMGYSDIDWNINALRSKTTLIQIRFQFISSELLQKKRNILENDRLLKKPNWNYLKLIERYLR